MTGEVGVLVMAHGTPRRSEEVLPFYTRIRRGRPPTDEQLAELQARYAAIGGLSPLNERTVAQVDGLRAHLAAHAGGRFVVAFGAKHTDPLIEEAAATLRDTGVRKVIGLVLTPHGSSMGSEEYHERARAVLEPECPFVAVPPWYAHRALVRLLAERVRTAVASLGAEGASCPVVFTAHSIPEKAVAAGDTYPEQLATSARLVAEAAGVEEWLVAWQSAGRTPDPWLGPDVRDVVRQLGAAGGNGPAGFVVCPIGFVSDHLEVLYDLDVELAAVASEVGLRMVRTASLNDDPLFMDVLADLVCAADADAGDG